MNQEQIRLMEAREQKVPWRKWGPYLSERQWGTVREDYSEGGDAWDYFSHDQARSRAYRWGEDGLAGISDDKQRLCFALALWNARDPILKERLFGLTNSEGNHGEDVKEYYFYLDSTPTHSYMKYLYKYPQAPFPYADLVETNRRRGRSEFEYELIDTGVFDRSAPLPTGGYLEQADGTAWMALFCQNMLEIAAELAMSDPGYADMALKFAEHFLWIASSMAHLGEDTGMWDDGDGFFYDVLRLPTGEAQRLKVRSMVGLLPLCAATCFDANLIAAHPKIGERFRLFLDARPELCAAIHDPRKPGFAGRRLASVLNEDKLRRVLAKMLDENEFLSPFGIRSLSRYHVEHPYVVHTGGQEYRVAYLPAESDTGMFGGNSKWRGPIWMPVNALIIRALLQYYEYYGNEFTVECPTGSGRHMTLYQVAEEISRRLAAIFLRDQAGRGPVCGGTPKFQDDPHWRDCLLFYEYFHGDNGAGLGASHQTGWTGVIARCLHLFASLTPETMLARGKETYAKQCAEEKKAPRASIRRGSIKPSSAKDAK